MNPSIQRTENYYIQVLSPVHIGSGLKLHKGLDFITDSNYTWRIDKNGLEREFVNHPEALNFFVEEDEPNIHRIATQYKFDLEKMVLSPYRGHVTNDMFEFYRDGNGTPCVPGSSIKGALRTVILWKLSTSPRWQQDRSRLLKLALGAWDQRFAGNEVVNRTFNIAVNSRRPNDANRDLMRVLRVGDVHFSLLHLHLADGRIMNAINETQYGWKRMGGRNEDQPSQATQLAAEALRGGAVASVQLTIDEFLLNNDKAQQEARFNNFTEIFENLPAICNAYARRQIKKQLSFFKKYNLLQLVDFYTQLQRQIEQLSHGDFILRLAWGSGWQGMTGELFDNPEEMKKLRDRFNLGKFIATEAFPDACPNCGSSEIRKDRNRPGNVWCFACKRSTPLKRNQFPEFPKTRKIAIEGGAPRYPFGWVVFRKQKPDIEIEFEELKLVPQASKETNKGKVRGVESKPVLPKIHQKPKQVLINRGDQLRAEIIKAEGDNFTVKLLEKDQNRTLAFQKKFMRLAIGNTVKVRVIATTPEGDQVTKIEFVSKVG